MPYKLSILIVFCRKINMNGMINIVNKYVEMRSQVQDGEILTEEKLKEFGESLLELTTMAEERDIVRKYIEGLSDNEQVTDIMFF